MKRQPHILAIKFYSPCMYIFFMRSMLIANSQLKFVIKRNQEEKSFQSKQENNSESIRNVLQNKRIHLKQENNKRNLFIQSKKTTQILSKIIYKIKEPIQSKKTTREISSFKARKQLWIYQECIILYIQSKKTN